MVWNALTGVIEWWADEELRDLGRGRFHQGRGASVTTVEPLPRGAIDRSSAGFVARRVPWRLALLSLDSVSDGPVVVAWADDATVVLDGEPAVGRVASSRESWGDLGARGLLFPERLERLVPKPWSDRFEVEGDLLSDQMDVLPEFVSLATDHYKATYDAQLDVLTSWTAFIDGEPAARHSLSQLVAI